MPIREVGFQLRDQSPQLVLEWDVSQSATFLADAVGDLSIGLTGSMFEVQAAAPEFRLSPDINENVVILGDTSGTGVLFVRSAVNNIQFQVGLTTILALEPSKLTAFGTFDLTGSIEVSVGGIQVPDGSEAAPIYSFSSAIDSGLYLEAARVSISEGGARIARFGQDLVQFDLPAEPANGVRFRTEGGPNQPGFFFTVSESMNEVYLNASASTSPTTLLIQTNAAVRLTLNATAAAFTVPITTTGVTSTGAFLAADGIVTAPSFAFSTEIGARTGMYLPATNTIGFTSVNVLRFSISNVAITPTVAIRGIDGSVGSAAYSFTSDTDSGMLLESAGVLAWTVAGSKRLSLDGISALLTVHGHVIPDVHDARDLGQAANRWANLYLTTKLVIEGTVGGEMIKLRDTGGTGIVANPWIGYYDLANSQLGVVGFISGGNQTMYFRSIASTIFIDAQGGEVQFATQGAARVRIDDTRIFPNTNGTYACGISGNVWSSVGSSLFLGGLGSEDVPTYSFLSDPDTGMFRIQTDGIGFSTGGVERLRINNSETISFQQFRPSPDSTYDLGTSSSRWRTLYVDNIIGPASWLGILAGTINHDFGTVAANSFEQVTVTVTGAGLNDIVIVGQAASRSSGIPLVVTATVQATNLVRIMAVNGTNVAASSGGTKTYRLTVFQRT